MGGSATLIWSSCTLFVQSLGRKQTHLSLDGPNVQRNLAPFTKKSGASARLGTTLRASLACAMNCSSARCGHCGPSRNCFSTLKGFSQLCPAMPLRALNFLPDYWSNPSHPKPWWSATPWWWRCLYLGEYPATSYVCHVLYQFMAIRRSLHLILNHYWYVYIYIYLYQCMCLCVLYQCISLFAYVSCHAFVSTLICLYMPVRFLWVCVCVCPFGHTAYVTRQVLWTSIPAKKYELYSPRWEDKLDCHLMGWMDWERWFQSFCFASQSQQEPNTNQDLFCPSPIGYRLSDELTWRMDMVDTVDIVPWDFYSNSISMPFVTEIAGQCSQSIPGGAFPSPHPKCSRSLRGEMGFVPTPGHQNEEKCDEKCIEIC